MCSFGFTRVAALVDHADGGRLVAILDSWPLRILLPPVVQLTS